MTLWNDLRLAARVLVKERMLTLAAVAALALGIAATTTVFTIVNGALFRDLPFDQPDRIVALGTRVTQGNRGVSYLDLQDWRARTRTMDGVVGFSQSTMNLSDGERSVERFGGVFISAGAFGMLGHQPILGREFSPEDDRPGAASVLVLGHGAWQSRYGGDRNVIGRTVTVNGTPATIVGVMGEGFMFPFRGELWQPLGQLPPELRERRDARSLGAAGRLRPGVTIAQAQQDLGLAMTGLAQEYPSTNPAELQPRVIPYRQLAVAGPISLVMYSLLGAVGFVLLIACANVANLLLARAADRTREISVRMAMGASRWHIVRQLLVESLLLSAVAGVVGLGLATAGVRLFAQAVTGTGEPYWLDFSMDLGVFAFFAAICVGTALLFGLAPALHTSNLNVSETLNETGRGSAGTRRARQWSGALVVLQLALAPVLLAGAGLMIRTFLAQYQADLGIETAGVVRMRLDVTQQQYPEPAQRAQFYRRLDERLASLPGLRAALAVAIPGGGTPTRELTVEGRPEPDTAGGRPVASLMTVGPRYFETLGAGVRRGRTFTQADGFTGEVPAVVNARFAALHFAGEDPLGRRVRLRPVGGPPTGPLADTLGDEWVTIVGVTGNIRQRDTQDGQFDPVVYVPYAANPLPITNVLVRTDADPGTAAAQLREAVAAVDPNMPLFDVSTLDEQLAFDRWPLRVFGGMFTLFAVAAFIMASVGLYGVTARSVAQRTREIGVRVALGAEAREIWWTVTRRGSIQLAIGLVIGMAGALGVGRLLQGILVQVSPVDPVTMTLVPVALVLVGFLASLVPARRAMRLDPVVALRHE